MIEFETDYLNFIETFAKRLNSYIASSLCVDKYEPYSQRTRFCFESNQKCGHVICDDSPFKISTIKVNGIYTIVYNETIIRDLRLTVDEQFACILHEIGHCFNESTSGMPYDEAISIESLCDNYAVIMGVGEALISALKKMKEKYPKIDITRRIDCLTKGEQRYMRPEWTCGRYNSNHKAAIYYNLIDGMSYYLEDHSAQLIGYVLSIEKQRSFSLVQLSMYMSIPADVLNSFMYELMRNFMIVPLVYDVETYRRSVARQRRARLIKERSIEQKLPMTVSNAETEYTKRVGGITNVMFELTYRCSERCIHCYNPGATRNDFEVSYRGDFREMTLDDYKRVIDELYEQGLTKVCISGGDPFSKTIAWDIIDYITKKDIAFDVYTNGQMLVGHTKRLADYYPRLVGISIYSGLAEEHDFITRTQGSWQKSLQVISELSDLAVPLNIKCCIMKPNLDSYYLVNDIAKQYGAVAQFEVSMTDSIDGDKCVSRYLRLSPKEYEIVLRDSNIPLYVGEEVPDYGRQSRDYNQNPCGAGENSFCISPKGDLIPCCSFHLKFGNLCENSLVEVLESETLKWWRGLKLSEYEECGKHDYCDYCNLCPGNNHSQWGTPLKAGENNCYVAKIRYALAMKMKNEGYDPFEGKTLVETLKSHRNTKIKIKREMSREMDDLE